LDTKQHNGSLYYERSFFRKKQTDFKKSSKKKQTNKKISRLVKKKKQTGQERSRLVEKRRLVKRSTLVQKQEADR
jgi:hypothetical protein